MGLIPHWARWRFGERVCVACGAEEVVGVVDFPPPWWTVVEDISLVWSVPVCGIHGRVTIWPVQSMLGLAAEMALYVAGQPERAVYLGLWEWAESVKGPSDSEGAVAIP